MKDPRIDELLSAINDVMATVLKTQDSTVKALQTLAALMEAISMILLPEPEKETLEAKDEVGG